MAIKDQKKAQGPGQYPDVPSGVENLYIGAIQVDEKIKADINGELEAYFSGDLLLYGQFSGDDFQVQALRRVALYGVALRDYDFEPIGVISLAGPVRHLDDAPVVRELEKDNEVILKREFPMQLHYRALSTQRPPRSRTQDSVSPRLEYIRAKLTLRQVKEQGLDAAPARLDVELTFPELIHAELGKIQQMSFDRFTRSFRLAGAEPQRRVAKHDSLNGCLQVGECEPEKKNLVYNQDPDTVHRLPLKFINVSSKDLSNPNDKDELEALCQKQIDTACEIWWKKAALELDVASEIDDADNTLKTDYQEVGPEKQVKLPCAYAHSITSSALVPGSEPCDEPPTDPFPDHVEVYIVDQVLNAQGNSIPGVVHDGGQASAYCILQLDRLSQIEVLLAHELGHVLGVDHPRTVRCPGERGTIMHARFSPPFFSAHVRQNIKILAPRFADDDSLGRPCLNLLNPIVRATTATRTFCLDG